MAERTSDGGSKNFDPRFSREFQPGFDPRVHREAPPSVSRESAPRPTTPSLITRTTRVTDAATAAPGRDSDAGADAAPDGTAAPSTTAASSEPHADTTPEDDQPFWRRLNPYLVALGVIGVALIGASLGWMGWVYSIANSPLTQQFDYLIMQFAMFGAPILLSVGVASLLSILVVLAVKWRRRT